MLRLLICADKAVSHLDISTPQYQDPIPVRTHAPTDPPPQPTIAMRSQHWTFVTIPIPTNLPPQTVVTYLQTYAPTLRHNDHVASFTEVASEPVDIANDDFFGPWDDSVRTFQIHEVTRLLPGISKENRWPVVFQSFPNGINSRANAHVGTIVWARWTVRRRADVGSPANSESTTSSSATEIGEEWELYEEVLMDGNTMVMPFASRIIDKVHQEISQRLVDDVVKAYFNETPVLVVSGDIEMD
ncbi:hypothetical protein EDB81DRAFT_814375 [Dactylonectria macrodidyma]|uniref:DUF7053 domain-containing protein n=1 Tax=Dactylonectria macrodidyma TaxID=307937 RepID=A0A9P9DKF2_9HYPO|nr:hypothetical protein EDB81DRAFT_814375 [Dactylonectria macrodidyma]